MESDHRKRSKELEQQKRRNIQAANSNSKLREPLFGKPIEKRGGDDRIQEILGSYRNFPSNWEAQQRCLGVADSNPSTSTGTPLALSKQSNPFNSISTATSLTSSSTGAASSRHQVAEPPTGQSVPSLKREKGRASSKLPKPDSRANTGSTSKGKVVKTEDKPILPTNTLRVKKPNKTSVKPHKASQKKTSPSKTSIHSKLKVKKSHSSSQLPISSDPPTSELHTNPSTTSSHKPKKHLNNVPSTLLQMTPLSTYNTTASSIKRVSSAGALLSRTDVKIEPTDVASKAAKKKKKKKVKKESSDVAPAVAESLDGHVIAEPAPTSLRVQLPKQKRPLELQLVADASVSVSEDTTMEAESVSTMLKELMNPLPSTLVTPLPTPVKSRPFVFPPAVPQLPTVTEIRHFETKSRLCSSSSEEGLQDSKSREALATAISTLENNMATETDHTHLHMAPPPHQRVRSSSSSSSSDDSSSDSSSDGETEEDDLDLLSKHMSLPTTTITPIKTTPPRRISQQIISPLALDESANLSPAKSKTFTHFPQTSTGFNPQTSTGFNPQTSTGFNPQMSTGFNLQTNIGFNPQTSTGFNPQTSTGFNHQGNAGFKPIASEQSEFARGGLETTDVAMDSDSDSSSGSSSDSGSESDSESSDSEEESVVQPHRVVTQSNHTRTNLNLSQGSEDGLLPFNNSGGFLEGTDFLSGLSSIEAPSNSQSITSHTGYQAVGSESMQPSTVTSNPITDTTSAVASPTPVPAPGVDMPAVTTHHKRKHPSSQRTARKAPKLTIKEAATAFHTQDTRPLAKRTISITSSEYHSEEGEVSSETEDHSVFSTASTSTNQITQPGQSCVGTHGVPSSNKEHTESFVVRYALAELKRVPDQHKPKAKVEPFRQTTESRTRSRPPESEQMSDRHDDPRGVGRERSEGRSRDGYGSVSGSRHRDEYSRSYHRDRSSDRPRSHRGASRWERESSRDRRYPPDDRHHLNGRGWDRGEYDYWTDDHSDYGGERSRGRGGRYGGESQNYPEKFMSEARRKKHEADKMPHSVEKAKAYMESVVLFMKYGDATEQQSESSNAGAKKTSAFRTYSETVAMIKYCQNMANDCKPLVVLCMRCQSVLLWRMYLIKLPAASTIQKELQEYFIPPKGAQGKSPYPNSSSPLPSPASVGSTTSTGSGGWTASQDPSPSGSATVPKHIVNKATEHLTISGYVSNSVELWKTSESLMSQYRDYFSKHDHTASQRMSHHSPVSHVATWSEKVLRNIRYNSY